MRQTYIPLEAVGGDVYDIWQIRDDTYGLFIGDVTGHGLPAAFIGAMTKMVLAYAPKESPDIMLDEMNEGIVDHMPEGRFVTVAAAIYDSGTGALKVARGGHPEPYIWRKATGKVERISPRGMAIGIMKGMPYELFETNLEVGDKYLMITDGLIETEDMNGNMFGADGVGNCFESVAPQKNIAECIRSILERQREFSGGRILKDDDTLVGLERTA